MNSSHRSKHHRARKGYGEVTVDPGEPTERLPVDEEFGLLVDKQGLLKMCPGLTRGSLEWLIRTRKIPLVKIGKRIYFSPEEIRRWIHDCKVKAIKGDT